MMREPINGPGSRSSHALPVLKLAAGGVMRLTVQSDNAIFVNTHWVGRRLWCCEEDCPCCEVNPVRTVGYFVASFMSGSKARPLLVETTPNELARLDGFLSMESMVFGSGLVLDASRRLNRSPVRFEPVDMEGWVCPKWRSIRRALAAASVLAGVVAPDEGEDPMAYMDRIRLMLRSHLQRSVQKLQGS